MGFWICVLLTDMLIPLIMLGFGCRYAKRAPGKMTSSFSYRTSMSMKNRDTWEFAHRHLGKLWRACGLILAPLAAVPMLLVLGRDAKTVGTVGNIVRVVQLIVVIIVSAFPTERALKKNFDENGKRRGNG